MAYPSSRKRRSHSCDVMVTVEVAMHAMRDAQRRWTRRFCVTGEDGEAGCVRGDGDVEADWRAIVMGCMKKALVAIACQ